MYVYAYVCVLVLGRLRRLIADRISVNKRNKHFRTGMSSDLSTFPLRYTVFPAPGNRSMGRRLAVSPSRPIAAPIAATFLAQLQRPVKIAQIRDDAFAPGAARIAERGIDGGGRVCGRLGASMQGVGGSRMRCTGCPFNSLDCAPCRHSTDLGLELGTRNPVESTLRPTNMACPHEQSHTFPSYNCVSCVCRAIHPAIDTRSRRCQPWILAPLILPDLCA